METNLSSSNPWWTDLVQCPACGENPFKNNSRGNLKCQSCNKQFKLTNNQIDWTPENETTRRYDYPKNKWVFLKRALNPLSNPLLPFRYWSNFRNEQFYNRTLSDQKLAEKWGSHYLSRIKLPENATVLDHGCGRGRNVGLLNQLGYQVVGQDMIENIWWEKLPNTGFQVLPPDCNVLPWKNSSFDLVTGIGVVGCLNRGTLDSFAKEIKRVLKPGGFWLILEANDKSFGYKHFQNESLLPLDLMRSLATKNGFKEIDTSYEGFYASHFPLFINFLRKQCGPWPFDISDYNSWIAKQIPPEKRGIWVMRLKCMKNE